MALVRGDQMLLMMSDFFYTDQAFSKMVQQQKGEEAKKQRTQRRSKKREDQGLGASKRKLTKEQTDYLELSFQREQKLETDRKHFLASEINLEPDRVAVWFQNRRQRWKNKQIENKYLMMKAQVENAVVENRRLEAEVMKLRERICKVHKENQRLMERLDTGFSSNSPISEISTVEDAIPIYLWDYRVLGLGILSVPRNKEVDSM